MSFEDVVAELGKVRWGSATTWDNAAKTRLDAHYRRLLRYWPEERRFLEPASRVIEEAVLVPRTADERARIAEKVDTLLDEARARREKIEATTERLLSLVLAWALAVEAGELPPEADPGAPLVELFLSGYQLVYTDAGIEMHYTGGWMIARVPTRAAVSGASE
jgi:hypothetical protein